jgi:glutathione S-transferase fosA5
MIQAQRLHHVAITSANPERSIAFYQETLGMKVQHQWGDVTIMAVGDTYLAIDCRRADSGITAQSPVRIHHFAFKVDRQAFELAKTWLPTRGISVKLESHEGNDSLYFHDPDHHLIELVRSE